jgi:nitrate reductase gamma subunit
MHKSIVNSSPILLLMHSLQKSSMQEANNITSLHVCTKEICFAQEPYSKLHKMIVD